MISIEKKVKDLNKSDIDTIVSALEKGRVVVLPTDTIYGLSCLANNKKAINKIYDIKGREKGKPFIVLVSSLSMASKYAHINKQKREIVSSFWQKKEPTSLILQSKANLASGAVSSEGSISMRLPKSDFLIKIIRKLKVPLVSTSLNKSGEKPILDINNLKEILENNPLPDLVVNSGPSSNKNPSKIIDLRTDEIKIIR